MVSIYDLNILVIWKSVAQKLVSLAIENRNKVQGSILKYTLDKTGGIPLIT